MKLEIESSLEFEHTPNRLVASKGANLQLECRVDCNSSLARPRIRIEKLGSVSTTNQLSITGNGTNSKLVFENIDQQRDGGPRPGAHEMSILAVRSTGSCTGYSPSHVGGEVNRSARRDRCAAADAAVVHRGAGRRHRARPAR